MANSARINKILHDHERRISALESVLAKPKPPKVVKGKKSLSDCILELRDKGFFSQPQTIEETHKKLQGIYPCEIDRVAMALLRLANKRQLRKTSKIVSGKQYKSYVS